MRFQVLKGEFFHPRNLPEPRWTQTFSVGVGPVREGWGFSAAAWYRVKGKSCHHVEVDALAERLRVWLEWAINNQERCPAHLVDPGLHESATIVLTKAGKAAGFYGLRGPRGGK